MNYTISIILTTICILLFASNNKITKRLRRDIDVIQARADFMASQNVHVDSTRVNKDTIFYFNNGIFLGSSVVVRK